MNNRYSRSLISRRHLVLASASACASTAFGSAQGHSSDVEAILSEAYRPLIEQFDIPGLVVGVIRKGQRYFFERGHTARHNGLPCSRETLFEVGSISKCFTTILAAYAQSLRFIHLHQEVGEIVQSLRGSPIGRATLLHLATYTAGGLPLQFPDNIVTPTEALAYLYAFQPTALPGLIRRYSNPSIGLLGHATAKALGGDFSDLMERDLFAFLGLSSTFIRVPPSQTYRYAWGHDKENRQVRVNPGVFDAQAYGVKSSASDMLAFLQAQLDPSHLPAPMQSAILKTMAPRYQVGPMQQCMGWEMYSSPLSVDNLLEGNGPRTIFESLAAQPIRDKTVHAKKVLIRRDEGSAIKNIRIFPDLNTPILLNKTGSTFGFGAYMALVPDKKTAIVMLANRNCPISARVTAAWKVMKELGAID
jgi:beta-lactamase class C